MQDQAKPHKDDKQPLLTFLTTVIRRRVWFYWFSALGLVVAIAAVLLPQLTSMRSSPPKLFTAQLYMKAVSVPEALSPYFGQSFGDDTAFYLTNLGLVADVYRRTIALPEQLAMQRPQFNGVIKDFISDSMTVKKTEDSSFVALTVSGLSEDRGRAFLKAMAEEVALRIRNSVLARADVVRSANGPETATARLLDSLLSNPQFPCVAVDDVVIVDTAVNRIRIGPVGMAALILIGFMVLGLVATLVREAVANLAIQPEIARAFQEAWKKAGAAPRRNE